MNARSSWNLLAALSLVSGFGLANLAAQTAAAADAEKKSDTIQLQKFEVTGSSIKRIDTEGPAPVAMITRETIELSGSNTVQDVLKRIPSNFAGVNENVNNQGATGGTGNVNLRGLGAEATLLLVNGRRVAPSAATGATSFVNINSLPLAAVERIEVLQDGASAIYGSDAIGGVVNVILRKDYSGSEATVRYGNTFLKDVGEIRASFVVGANSGKASAMVVFDYFDRASQLRPERSFSRTAQLQLINPDARDQSSPTGNPGTVYLRPGSAYLTATNPLGLPANPSGVFGIPDGSTGVWTNASTFAKTLLPGVERVFDFAAPNQNIPAVTRLGLVSMGSYQMNDRVQAFTELSYSKTETNVFLAATPVSANSGSVNVIPANNPYNPFGEPVNFRFRPLDVGPRTDFITTADYRFLFGLKGTMFDTWNWETGFMLNSSKFDDIGIHYIVTTDVIAAASGTLAKAPGLFLNVFGDKQGNNPLLLKALDNTVTTNGELTQQQLDGKVSGEIFDLPAGAVGIAIGGEARKEKLVVFLDPLTQSGAFAGSGTRENTYGVRAVNSVYAELSVPLVSKKQNYRWLQSSELQIAVREEKYDVHGKIDASFKSTKPKYAISIRPTKDLLFRASYAEGFRAPSLFELLSGANSSFPSINDPLRSRLDSTITNAADIASLRYWVPSTPAGATSVFLAGTGIAADDSQQVQQAQSGNVNLKPETSKANYVGLVYNVPGIKNLTVSTGWSKIKHMGIIKLPSTTALNIGVIHDPALQFLVRRDPPTPADIAAGRPGRYTATGVTLFLQYVNRAVVETESYDFEVNYKWKNPSWGEFNHDIAVNYFAHYWDQTTTTSVKGEGVGTGFTSQGTIPRVKGTLQNSWKLRQWTASAFVNYTGHYYDFTNVRNTFRTVEAYVTLDLQASYKFRTPWLGGNTTVTAGLINATDTAPSFVTENIAGAGYDTQVADPRGRMFYVQMRQSF